MRLPTTYYHHGYSSNRRGSSTGVKSHFLLPIPGWEVKTYHYMHHTAHYSATDHPRGRIRQGPYPTISGTRPYPPTIDPSSTRPRTITGQQGGKADVAQDSESFHRPVLYVTMVSRDGRPFSGHVATATSTGIDKTSPQRHSQRPCLLLPYKRAGQGSTKGQEKNEEQQTTKNQSPSHHQRSTSQATSYVLSLFL
jgi:hypothetical protein